MRKLLTRTGAALAIAGATLTAAVPAQARWYGGGYHYYHGGGAGPALAAGILGLGVGAAIASNHYYAPRYYGPAYGPAYYAPPPPPYGYYAGGYCRSDWRWDGYRGRYVRVRYCD